MTNLVTALVRREQNRHSEHALWGVVAAAPADGEVSVYLDGESTATTVPLLADTATVGQRVLMLRVGGRDWVAIHPHTPAT